LSWLTGRQSQDPCFRLSPFLFSFPLPGFILPFLFLPFLAFYKRPSILILEKSLVLEVEEIGKAQQAWMPDTYLLYPQHKLPTFFVLARSSFSRLVKKENPHKYPSVVHISFSSFLASMSRSLSWLTWESKSISTRWWLEQRNFISLFSPLDFVT